MRVLELKTNSYKMPHPHIFSGNQFLKQTLILGLKGVISTTHTHLSDTTTHTHIYITCEKAIIGMALQNIHT